MKKIKYLFAFLLVISMSSCEKWLSVKPKAQIDSEDNFKTEQGFKDALTGVYLNLSSTQLYGMDMTWGFVDVLAKQYTEYSSSQNNTYSRLMDWNYTTPEGVEKIRSIWKGMYYSIANLNNIIDNIDKSGSGIFSGTNYNVIKGECLGLRAFHHFDLLRLFAPSPSAAGGLTAPGIPYREHLDNYSAEKFTIAQDLEKIVLDLKSAATLLETADPIKNTQISSTDYLRDRKFKFNYYAVQSLLARVYLYAGDYEKALEHSKIVINDSEAGKFPVTPIAQVINGNRIFSTEVIFYINMTNLNTLVNENFVPSANTNVAMSKSNALMRNVFDVQNNAANSSDYRYQYWTIANSSTSAKGTITKLYQELNTNLDAVNRLPLVRLSEMYYIAAESCLKIAGKRLEADTYLNKARANRGLAPLSTNLSTVQFQDEIFKEYRKEFLAEGQLFYYYKRLNLPNIITTTNFPAGPAVYNLPFPDDEIEYGNVK